MYTQQRKWRATLVVFLLTGLALMGCASRGSESEDAAAAGSNAITDIVWEWETLMDRGGSVEDRDAIQTCPASSPDTRVCPSGENARAFIDDVPWVSRERVPFSRLWS